MDIASRKTISSQLNKQGIDFFHLDINQFTYTSNFQKEIIDLTGGNYLNIQKHLFNLKNIAVETVVFNFQVGKGKTSVCYELIEEYEKLGALVIVCSPFIKLVEKDYQELRTRIENKITSGLVKGTFKKVAKYSDINDIDQSIALTSWCNVHVMTINCLLGNSGDNLIEQGFLKQDYIQNLIDKAKKEVRKVVIFIDEVHESVDNFSSILMPNLLRWEGLVTKVFIASATFTPATIPVIQACSLLTNKEIRIYESPRVKDVVQADVHLHTYSSSQYDTKTILELIEVQIKIQQDLGKFVNVITGTKKLAEDIAGFKCFSKCVKSLKNVEPFPIIATINLLTSGTDVTYQEGQNNVGTTFKTGENITSKSGVLIIVIPADHKSIFSDGIPSIIQSLGRLRNGGEIYIYLRVPNEIIGQRNDYPSILSNLKEHVHIPVNNSYDIIVDRYKIQTAKLETEIALMESNLKVTTAGTSVISTKAEFGLWYPNLHEYLMKMSVGIMLKEENPSFGRSNVPFVLWALIYDQFTNCRLKTITNHKPNSKIISCSEADIEKEISKIVSSHKSEIQNISVRESLDNASKYVGEFLEPSGEMKSTLFAIDGKSQVNATKLLNNRRRLRMSVANAIYSIYKYPAMNATDYVNTCIYEATNSHSTELHRTYNRLGELKKQFLTWLDNSATKQKGKSLISSDIYTKLPQEISVELRIVIEDLIKHDVMFRTKAIDLLPRPSSKDSDSSKRKMVAMLQELFTETSSVRRTINNSKYYEFEHRQTPIHKNQKLL